MNCSRSIACLLMTALLSTSAYAQMGRRWPSEKKIVIDPVTSLPLTFLTSTDSGYSQSKIYQTHPQWTSDGKWLIFRSTRESGPQAMAVNEETGDIVQVTDTGYFGMLCVGRKSMKLYIVHREGGARRGGRGGTTAPNADQPAVPAPAAREGGMSVTFTGNPAQVIEINLETLLADAMANQVKPASNYQRVCGTFTGGLNAAGDMALDANEDYVYCRVTAGDVGTHLPPGTEMAKPFGPRNMGAGPSGLRSVNLKTGEIKVICDVPFQMGHVQTNPWVPGEIVFCWETGGKAPQRTWTIMADGSGMRPLYPEAPYEWITHEAVITKDEVAIAIMGHRRPGTNDAWGTSGTREHPTGLGIVNLRTRQMRIVGQTPSGSGLWHVNGSADGRWAVGDDFTRSLYLIDRHTSEMMMLTTGHNPQASDHVHPTFNAAGTKIEIESAMLYKGTATTMLPMNICVVPLPKAWLDRKYTDKVPE